MPSKAHRESMDWIGATDCKEEEESMAVGNCLKYELFDLMSLKVAHRTFYF